MIVPHVAGAGGEGPALQRAGLGPATAEQPSSYLAPAEVGDRVFTGHRVSIPRERAGEAPPYSVLFQGPVDLLIYLVEHGEVDVFEVAIRTITSQYVGYLAGLEALDIELAGEFAVMAAQLMEIKSRALLPQEERPGTDEEEVGDPRAQLLARLVEYRRYKVVAEELRERGEMQRWVFSRSLLPHGNGNGNGNGHGERAYLMLNDVSPFDLWAAFQSVLNRVQQAGASGEVVRPRFTVGQKMALIATRLRWATSGLRFAELFTDDCSLMELIVTFLALLELIRLHRVRVVQEAMFGEIWVHQR